MSEPEPKPVGSKRPRGAYSRLICLGCRDRRIRCELPNEIEIPAPGELRTVQTPCYRCKRLGVPCVVRQTILGRPGAENISTAGALSRPIGSSDNISRIVIELPTRKVAHTRPNSVQDEAQLIDSPVVPRTRLLSSNDLPLSQAYPAHWNGNALLIHKPQSTETVIIIRAIDTLRSEKVEREWFRHLGAHVGHTQALDLSIKAIVSACAFSRGVPKLTSGGCYQALALALNAVQTNIQQSHGELNDDVLASTALLAHIEGLLKKHGIPTRLHLQGLAAILATRSTTYPVTQLAREIFDFHICDSALLACFHGSPSPFEGVARPYFANNRMGYHDSDQAQLRALGSELFIRIPRLVGLVRSLRSQTFPQNQLLIDALSLSKSLLKLQDSQAEARLLRKVKVRPSSDCSDASLLHQSLHFASLEQFEALAYYWQNRLWLLRLDQHLHDLFVSNSFMSGNIHNLELSLRPVFGPKTNEISQLVKNILMCGEYAGMLPLRKHDRLLVHAMLIVWGAMMDMPMTVNYILNGEGTNSLFEVLLRSLTIKLAMKLALNIEDAETAADIFVGGQLKGRFVEFFGS